MSYQRKPKINPSRLTMFRCNKCDCNLNEVEAFHGDACTKCIAKEKGIVETKAPETGRSMDAKILANLSKWESEPKDIALDLVRVNFMEKYFTVSVFCGDAMNLYAIIRTEDNTIIYNKGEGSKEGQDVFGYCQENKLIKIKKQ